MYSQNEDLVIDVKELINWLNIHKDDTQHLFKHINEKNK